nr:RHS repeat-associated core domain-containing protein [Saccharopolyspora sp. HNM0983]
MSERSDDPQSPTRDGEDRTTQGDPIDIATGEMIMQHTDVSLQSVLPLVLKRTHLSSYRVGRHFGPSWTSTLDQRLEFGSAGVSFAAEDGKLLLAPTPAVGATVTFGGSRHELTRHDDGSCTLAESESGRKLLFTGAGAVLSLTAIVDRNEHRIEVDRDAEDTPVEVRHSGGYRIRVESDDGLVTALYLREADNGEDVLLRRYTYEDRRLTGVINASGLPMRFTYDRAGRITSWTDRNDAWYRFVYDHEGRVIAGEGSGGFLSGTMEYDRENRITTWTNSQGARTTYHLNDAGQVLRQIDPLGAETHSEWDEHDRLLSRTDPLGRTTRYEYDEAGNLTAVTRPDGSQARVEYNELRLPITIIAPDGTVSRREYDERGNLTRAVDQIGATTDYTYGERGNLVSITDALSGVRVVEINAAGLIIAMTDPSGNTTRYERDAFGRAMAMIDPLGSATRYGWTIDGEPAWQMSPTGAIEKWLYDAEGNLRTHIDALGQATYIEYTGLDLPAVENRPDGTQLGFSYDTELRLASVTNEQGLIWRYAYDAAGNLAQETDFNGRLVVYRHDRAGQLVQRTNGAGETTHFVRDALGQVIERRGEGGTATFNYDELGRLIEAMNAYAQVTLRRDPLGRVLTETTNGRTVSSVYDVLGRRVRRRTPAGLESSWEFNPNGQPIALCTAGRILRFDYDAAGHEVHRVLGPGAVLKQTWGGNHELLRQQVHGGGDRQVQNRAYSYRADGVLTGVNDQLTGPRTFQLDRRGRVTAVQGREWVERYAYDQAGNITSASWPTADGVQEPDAIGDREYNGTLVRAAGNVRYEHDAQGRVVLRQRKRLSHKPETWRYFWDSDDRLVDIRTPDGTRWHYRYDPLGRRIAKQRITSDGARLLEQIEFTWDDTVLVEQGHTAESAPSVVRITSWDHEPGTFRPLAQSERTVVRDAPQPWIDEQFYSIITDLVGMPVELVNDQGGIAWFHRTNLWGNTVAQSRAGAYTPLRFPGQYHDPETGFNYNYHRHYDPQTGRFGSADPIGLVGGVNPHTYVSNPSIWFDPLGLSCEPKKRGPKPFGEGPHNQTIKAEADKVTDGTVVAGGQRRELPEAVVATPGGHKGSRRPDILVQRDDGSEYGINVGKQRKDGTPIKREEEAIQDLEGAGVPMTFVPYN